MTRVVKTVVAFHILKYPVGLQYTPLDDKFGLNGLAGGFLEPYQTERIRKFFDKDVSDTLQEISDSDPEAKSLAKQVKEMPDITDEELHAQVVEHDKQMIMMLGFKQWIKNEKKLDKDLQKESPTVYKEKLEYWKKMRKWAREQQTIASPKQ